MPARVIEGPALPQAHAVSSGFGKVRTMGGRTHSAKYHPHHPMYRKYASNKKYSSITSMTGSPKTSAAKKFLPTAERKTPRRMQGVASLLEIKKYHQKYQSDNLLIRKDPFARLIREISPEGIHWQREAMNALHDAVAFFSAKHESSIPTQ